MGKTKQAKEKKFDRNVEISAPILDPELIKQIHSPPKEQKLDVKNSGFKALLSDLYSQDSTDELAPIMETNRLPSYIGISCAVSGYSGYSAYIKKPPEEVSDSRIEHARQSKLAMSNRQARTLTSPNGSRTGSPVQTKNDIHNVHHITIDRSNISSPDQERKVLTEKLTASIHERRRSPSPLPPAPDVDRHHGAYVGARYCPLPPPSKLVHKHIPLLGIDDELDPDEYVAEDVNKVEEKIATLYGDDFVENWRESMSHKVKGEHIEEEEPKKTEALKNPKDLVTLKPTPPNNKPESERGEDMDELANVPTPNVKVLASVEKKFLNRLLTDENPPMPKSPSPLLGLGSARSTPAPDKEQQEAPVVGVKKGALSSSNTVADNRPESPRNVPTSRGSIPQSPSSPISRGSLVSPDSQRPLDSQQASAATSPEPQLTNNAIPDHDQGAATNHVDRPESVSPLGNSLDDPSTRNGLSSPQHSSDHRAQNDNAAQDDHTTNSRSARSTGEDSEKHSSSSSSSSSSSESLHRRVSNTDLVDLGSSQVGAGSHCSAAAAGAAPEEQVSMVENNQNHGLGNGNVPEASPSPVGGDSARVGELLSFSPDNSGGDVESAAMGHEGGSGVASEVNATTTESSTHLSDLAQLDGPMGSD